MRTIFDTDQLKILQDSFRKCHRPSKDAKLELARRMNVPLKSVKTWFQNRRSRCLNKHKLRSKLRGIPLYKVHVLEKKFSVCRYPSGDVQIAVAEDLGVPKESVVAWFKNQRRIVKKKLQSVRINSGNDYSKRNRTFASTNKQFTLTQILLLEKQFVKCPYPSKLVQITLARELGVKCKVIATWFENRRLNLEELHCPATQTRSDVTADANEANLPDQCCEINSSDLREGSSSKDGDYSEVQVLDGSENLTTQTSFNCDDCDVPSRQVTSKNVPNQLDNEGLKDGYDFTEDYLDYDILKCLFPDESDTELKLDCVEL